VTAATTAVDTHRRRLAFVEPDAQRLRDADGVGVAVLSLAGAHWIMFGESWGHPQENGSVVRAIEPTEGATVLGALSGRSDVDPTAGIGLLLMEADMLTGARTYAVSAAAVESITAAAQTMTPEPLHATDTPTRSGLAILSEPVLVPEVHPDYPDRWLPDVFVPVRAIGWLTMPVAPSDRSGPSTDGIVLFAYTTPEDMRAIYEPAMRATVENADLTDPGWPNGLLIPSDVLPWRFGVDWGERPTIVHEPGFVSSSVGWLRRWFLTFGRWVWQQHLIPSGERPLRHAVKRMERQTSRAADVVVLRLASRLRRYGTDDIPAGTLDARVAVAGHWRRQWFRSLGPAYLDDGEWSPESHRVIWIDPHFRGPDDGEPDLRPRVTVL